MTIKNSIYTYTTGTVLINNLEYAPDPCVISLPFTSTNTSLFTYYIKITTTSAAYTLPSNGQIGAVGGGGSATFTMAISRTKPVNEINETLPLTFNYYSDAGYTVLIGSDIVPFNMFFEDYSTGWDRTIYSFGTSVDGFSTASGFNRVTTTDIDASGGCLEASIATGLGTVNINKATAKTLNIPNKNKVRIGFHLSFKVYKLYEGDSYPRTYASSLVQEKLNSTILGKIDNLFSYSSTALSDLQYYGWYSATYDASALKNTSNAVLELLMNLYIYNASSYNTLFLYGDIDRVFIASKD